MEGALCKVILSHLNPEKARQMATSSKSMLLWFSLVFSPSNSHPEMGTWCSMGIWLLRSGVTGIPCSSYYNKIITVLLLWQNNWSLNHKTSSPLRLLTLHGFGLHSFNIICWKLQPATLHFYCFLHLDNCKVKSRWPTCQISTTSRIPNKKPYKPKYWRPLKTKQNAKLWRLQISKWRSSLLLNVRIGTFYMAQESLKLHLEMIIFCLFNIVNNILLRNFLLMSFLWVLEVVIKIIFIFFLEIWQKLTWTTWPYWDLLWIPAHLGLVAAFTAFSSCWYFPELPISQIISFTLVESAHWNSWLIEKDSDIGKDWRHEEERVTEDEMVGWHHQFNVFELGQTPGDGEGEGGLACCSLWGCRVRYDLVAEQQQMESAPCFYRFHDICSFSSQQNIPGPNFLHRIQAVISVSKIISWRQSRMISIFGNCSFLIIAS